MAIPYLENPPAVIPIDVGRQLFVDDFLIDHTTLERTFHHPEKYKGNPIFSAETPLELNHGKNACAVPKSGGVWWDARIGKFRMWYEAGWLNVLALAESRDGLHWERPDFGILPGTNCILNIPGQLDSTSVTIDDSAPAEARYRMLLIGPDPSPSDEREPLRVAMTSPDGIHWSTSAPAGPTGDRSTAWFDPFRRRWIFSLRHMERGIRTRKFLEHDDFLAGAGWGDEDPIPWMSADRLDEGGECPPQLYNIDAIAYESLMLGLFEIHKGPTNEVAYAQGIPKVTELTVGFSRDGFHWHRPDRRPFLGVSQREGSWDRGYAQSVGGVCVVRRDQLWFYYTAFAGDTSRTDTDWKRNGIYANGSTGVAFLRRDGFASMDATGRSGELVTRPVRFSGSRLFVNFIGELRVECLDEQGQPIAGFTAAESVPLRGDSTCARVTWIAASDLAALIGKPVRFRFLLSRGSLFSFWMSGSDSGASGGYLAAGSPDHSGLRDVDI